MEKITKPSDTVLIDPNEPLILPDGTALVGRIEWFLYALCCLDYQNLPTPMSRIEEFANALITGEIPNAATPTVPMLPTSFRRHLHS